MGAVLGAVPCVVERLRGHRVFSAWGGPVPLPGSCRAAWKWQVEPMLNGVSHMDRQVLPLRWMLAGAKRYARKRLVYTRDHDTTMTDPAPVVLPGDHVWSRDFTGSGNRRAG